MGSFADSSFPPVLLTPCHQGGILFCAMRGMIRISRTVFIAAAHNVVGHAHVAGDLVVGVAAGSTSGDALTIGHAKVDEALERLYVVAGVDDHAAGVSAWRVGSDRRGRLWRKPWSWCWPRGPGRVEMLSVVWGQGDFPLLPQSDFIEETH